MRSGQPLLVLENICKKYLSPVEGGLEVLKEINFRLAAGQSAAIVGPSGSGKSTLLNIIGTLDSPTSGSVFIEGQDVSELDEKEQAVLRNRKIGFVFQLHHLLPQCNALENVIVPSLVNRDSRDAGERARDLLAEVGLSDRMFYRPGQLSGGERQRVAVVRAMINGPRLLLADEPTGSLDKAGAGRLTDLLVDLNRQHGMTLVVVTHSVSLARRMDMVYELSEGKLVPAK